MRRPPVRFTDQRVPRGWFARQRGFVLITSYMVVAVLLILQSAYFSRIVEDQKTSARHTQPIGAIHYAEAGLDQAIASLRANPNYGGTVGAMALGNGAYNIAVTPYAGDNTLRRIAILGYSANPAANPAAIPKAINAIVKVATSVSNWAVFGSAGVSASGNTRVDGYNSSTGIYNGATATTNIASMATNSTANGGLTLTGNTNVGSGTLSCGQGCAPAGNILTGFNVVYGAKTSLTQPQTFSLTPTPSLPPGYAAVPVMMSGNSSMVVNAASPSVFMASNGRRAYVISSLQMSGNAQLLVDVTSGPIDVYVQGGIAMSGNARLGNQVIGGATSSVMLYQTSASSINMSGNASVTAAVYAPASSINISGNGTVYGVAIGNTVTLSGNANIHYDTALGNGSGSTSSVKLVEWNF